MAKSRVKEGVTPSGLNYRAVSNKNRTIVEVPKSAKVRQNTTGDQRLDVDQTVRGRVRHKKTGKVTSYETRTGYSDDRYGNQEITSKTKKLKSNPKLGKTRGDQIYSVSPVMRKMKAPVKRNMNGIIR